MNEQAEIDKNLCLENVNNLHWTIMQFYENLSDENLSVTYKMNESEGCLSKFCIILLLNALMD